MQVDHVQADAKLRLAGFIAANHFLASGELLRRTFNLGHEDLLIMLTVGLGNVQRMLRAPDSEGETASAALVAQDRIIAMSRRAVARATGLPRETVRRRTNAMVETGTLLEWGEGLRTARRLVVAPEVRDAIHELLELLAGTCRALQREGIVV